MNKFTDLNLDPIIQKSLESLGFTEPTEIQAKSIPMLLEKEKVDFLGQAQTGTGKTLAFGIPLLHRIDKSKNITQALIVAPTRELAVQICESINPLAKALGITIEAVYGGVSMEDQMRKLKRGTQIVVGTPGRLNDHLNRRTLNLSTLKTLVLDEADIMLDMGFKEEITEILTYAPKEREIWLFSATIKGGIADLMRSHMTDTVSVRVSKTQVGTQAVKHYYCSLPSRSRLNALCRFIDSAPEFYGIIFCPTKIMTSEIAEKLSKHGYQVGALHGDMSQSMRNVMIKKFKDKQLSIIVATDVAARGIDVANLTHVINFSLPEDQESYVHRVGRTGRAGKDGIAITFVGRNDTRNIQMLERKFGIVIKPIDVPSKETIMQARAEQASELVTSLISDKKEYKGIELVSEITKNLTQEQLQVLANKLLHAKFLENVATQEIQIEHSVPNNYNSSSNSRFSRGSGNSRFERGTPENIQEIYIALGIDDGIEKEDVVNYLLSSKAISESQIRKIRVIKRRTFIEIPIDLTYKIIDALKGKNLNGKRARLNIVN